MIDLVLDRARLSRSQFVFTETRGRPAIFWQTQKAAKATPIAPRSSSRKDGMPMSSPRKVSARNAGHTA